MTNRLLSKQRPNPITIATMAVKAYQRLEATVMRYNLRALQLLPENDLPEPLLRDVR